MAKSATVTLSDLLWATTEMGCTDLDQSLLALEWTLRLQRAAAHDSFYLALAESYPAQFWTADQRLVNAFAPHQKPAWLHWVGEMD